MTLFFDLKAYGVGAGAELTPVAEISLTRAALSRTTAFNWICVDLRVG